MQIKDLKDDMIGKKIKCQIGFTIVPHGAIQKEGSLFYICQNVKHGAECSDKLGYMFSWNVEDGSSSSLSSNDVINLVMLSDEWDTEEN